MNRISARFSKIFSPGDSRPEDIELPYVNINTSNRTFDDDTKIYASIPSIEHEIEFSSIDKEVNHMRNYQKLKIVNCPSIEEILPTILLLVKAFFIPFQSALCVYYQINGPIEEFTEIQLNYLVKNFDGLQKSFLIIFESMTSNLVWIYWRLKDTKKFFFFKLQDTAEFGGFMRGFLFNSLKSGATGIDSTIKFSKNLLTIPVTVEMFCDHRKFDLLFIAAENGQYELVKYLMKKLSIQKVVRGHAAIDLAFEKNYHAIVLLFLKANSKFPNNFMITPEMTVPNDLRTFVNNLNEFHAAIRNQDITTVERIINENPGLKFFYTTLNKSALAVAIASKSFEVYRLLIQKNIFLGPNEDFEDLLQSLTTIERNTLSRIHDDSLKSVTEKYILTLMTNTNVGFDDTQREKRLALVHDAFQRLKKNEICKLLLQIVAATRDFEINFDFNRDHVQFMDPKSESYTTGLFYLNGKIYIGAKDLLNPLKAHIVLGVIAHEFCHFVMFKVFRNMASPYAKKDTTSRNEFKEIIKKCNGLKGLEKIVSDVYNFYDKSQFAPELIVRYPHVLGHYISNPHKVREFERNFADLVNFFNLKVLPEMIKKLPEIEKESEEKVKRQYVKPVNVLKIYWKWILLLLVLITSSVVILLLNPCLFKNCGSNPSIFCRDEAFNAVCYCPNKLQYYNESCHECTHDSHCLNSKVCSNYQCFDKCDKKSCGTHEKARCILNGDTTSCDCSDDLHYASNTCVECIKNEHCKSGKKCKDNKCINPCDNSDCKSNDKNAYCAVEGRDEVCKCEKGLLWINGGCYECLKNSDCKNNYLCTNLECVDQCTICNILNDNNKLYCVPGGAGNVCSSSHEFFDASKYPRLADDDCYTNKDCMNSSDLYLCNDGKRIIKKSDYCNGIDDCMDGSDEKCVNKSPCHPSPCGSNSLCREIKGQSVCSCLQGMKGSPPNCRPACVTSSGCPLDKACINLRCVDPCIGICGKNANCTVENHSVICICPSNTSGDPFIECSPNIK